MAKNKNEETGVILKIQKQTGCLLFVIGAAMLAFVLTDFFKSGSSMFGGNDNVVGEIAGETIDVQELTAAVEELKEIYQGGSFDEEQLRDQAWNQLIQEKVIKREHRALGIVTSQAEIEDALFVNPDPIVIRNFTNPQTNQFDASMLRQFVEIEMQEDELKYKNYINFLEKPLREIREGQKYEAMVKAGVYTTKIDAEYDYNRESFRMSARSIGIPYTTVSDSAITYDDGDLKDFLEAHASEYQQLASRDIDFVVLNVFPSAEDTAATREMVTSKREDFKATKKDSAFVMNFRSLRGFNPAYMKPGQTELPTAIETELFGAEVGHVTEVYYRDGIFGMYKLTGVANDSVPSMRAQHVVLPAGDNAASEASSIMAKLRSGSLTFEEAAANNFDGTSANGGDLGWFTEEGISNVPDELRKRVFKSSVGSYFTVESGRGYHVVKVTGGPSTKTIQVAAYEKRVTPGLESDREVERIAGEIQYRAQDNDDFDAVVEGQGQNVREAKSIKLSNPVVPGVSDPKELVRWLFNDKTRVGDVSDVISLPDRYIVAVCKGIHEEGTMTIEDSRDQIVADYIQDKKGDIIAEQIKSALEKSKDADAVATELNAIVNIVPAVNMVSMQVAGIGAEPKVAGTIVGMKEGQVSEPIKGDGGVFVVWCTGQVQTADAQAFNEAMYKDIANQQMKGTVDESVRSALREKYQIKDLRYKFY